MFKNLRTAICTCGRKMVAEDIKGALEPCTIHGFYGGNVTHFAPLKCKCGKKYRGYLRAENNSYTVIDMEAGEKTEVLPDKKPNKKPNKKANK